MAGEPGVRSHHRARARPTPQTGREPSSKRADLTQVLPAGYVGAGLFLAFALTRYLRSLLYEVSPSDPGVFLAMALLLAGAACAASYLPARRAARIDPARALRAE